MDLSGAVAQRDGPGGRPDGAIDRRSESARHRGRPAPPPGPTFVEIAARTGWRNARCGGSSSRCGRGWRRAHESDLAADHRRFAPTGRAISGPHPDRGESAREGRPGRIVAGLAPGESAGTCSPSPPRLGGDPALVDVFTEAWEQGKSPAVEEYLNRLGAADSLEAVELIYREYCLAEADAGARTPRCTWRTPRHRESLERLLGCTALLDVDAGPMGQSGIERIGPAAGRRLDRTVRPAPRAGAGQLRAGLPGRAGGPGEPPGGREGLDAGDPRALAAGPGSARSHRRDHVAHGGGRRRVPVDLHAVLRRCHAGVGPGGAAGQGRPAASGRDLLADLDGVAAPEYPGTHAARPARELLARLSYDRATAWIVAPAGGGPRPCVQPRHGPRRRQAVEHPLSADGNPMLLDFNLARDGARFAAADPGGTLAYMAPERLRAWPANPGLDADSGPEPVGIGFGHLISPTFMPWAWSCWRRSPAGRP